MKRIILLVLAGLLVLGFMSEPGFAWAPATHIYITRKLDRRFGLINFQKMYGGIAPDIFSYVYRVPGRKYFEDAMHNDFMGVLTAADQNNLKAFALGFIGHNEVWGADYIALHEPDYIGKKADQLITKILEQNPDQFSKELKSALNALTALDYEHAHDLCCIAIEYSVDLLIKRKEDPQVGARLILATTLRDPNIPFLLARVYVRDQEESKTVINGETEFRKTMSAYGNDLMQDEKTAIKAVAVLIADIAPEALCINLPDKDKLVTFGIELIGEAMNVCQPDYSQLLSTTIETVKKKINADNFGADEDTPDTMEPDTMGLGTVE